MQRQILHTSLPTIHPVLSYPILSCLLPHLTTVCSISFVEVPSPTFFLTANHHHFTCNTLHVQCLDNPHILATKHRACMQTDGVPKSQFRGPTLITILAFPKTLLILTLHINDAKVMQGHASPTNNNRCKGSPSQWEEHLCQSRVPRLHAGVQDKLNSEVVKLSRRTPETTQKRSRFPHGEGLGLRTKCWKCKLVMRCTSHPLANPPFDGASATKGIKLLHNNIVATRNPSTDYWSLTPQRSAGEAFPLPYRSKRQSRYIETLNLSLHQRSRPSTLDPRFGFANSISRISEGRKGCSVREGLVHGTDTARPDDYYTIDDCRTRNLPADAGNDKMLPWSKLRQREPSHTRTDAMKYDINWTRNRLDALGIYQTISCPNHDPFPAGSRYFQCLHGYSRQGRLISNDGGVDFAISKYLSKFVMSFRSRRSNDSRPNPSLSRIVEPSNDTASMIAGGRGFNISQLEIITRCKCPEQMDKPGNLPCTYTIFHCSGVSILEFPSKVKSVDTIFA